MEIKVKRDEDEIVTKLNIDGEEQDFNYVKLINEIAMGNEVKLVQENIEDDLKEKIDNMYKEIIEVSKK